MSDLVPDDAVETTLRRLAGAATRYLAASLAELTVRIPPGPDRSVTVAPDGPPSPSAELVVRIGPPDSHLATLRLTRPAEAGPFTAEERAAAEGFAAAAEPAVESARLLDHTERRRAWALAGTDIATALMSGTPAGQVLREAAARVAELAEADAVGVLVPVGDEDQSLVIEAAVGPLAAEMEGVRLPLAETRLPAAHHGGVPRLIHDAATPLPGTKPAEVVTMIAHRYGPGLFIPLGGSSPMATLAVLRFRGGEPYGDRVLELAAAFARQATVAMGLVRSQERERRLQLQADRDRIARDLHDHVVQRIFATGLALDRIGRSLEVTAPREAARIAERVDELDGTITRIRESIFELYEADDASSAAVRRRLAEVVRSVTEGHGVRPSLRVRSEVEDLPPDLVPDLVAVVRELVTNVVRHAAASRLTVTVAIAGDVRVVVTDDGQGLPPVAVRSGLANLADRAERRGGRLVVSAAPSGTEIEWAVPLSG